MCIPPKNASRRACIDVMMGNFLAISDSRVPFILHDVPPSRLGAMHLSLYLHSPRPTPVGTASKVEPFNSQPSVVFYSSISIVRW